MRKTYTDKKMLNEKLAMDSREHVLNHERFLQIFAPYAEAIGINEEFSCPEWIALKEKVEKIAEEKLKAEAEAKRLVEEAAAAEAKRLADEQAAEARRIAEEEAAIAAKLKENVIATYFKQL